jgi:hypothetical protein
MNDSELIDKLGGPTKLAELLRFDRHGPQRVSNWRKRGIPARVKLDHPELFLRDRLSAPAVPAEEARDAA